MLAAERNGGLSLSRYQYDALSRVTAQLITCLPSGPGFARISTYKEAKELDETKKLSRDVVFEQKEFEYDAADNLISTTRRRRSPGASPQRETQEPGVLQSEQVRPQARVDHVAIWHDALGRVVSEADYGANGMAQLTRPAALPSSTDDLLVLKHAYVYNDKRRLEVYQVDPYGRVLRTTHDHAGRRMEVLENWTWGGTQPTRYSTFKYTPDGLIKTITASNVSDGSTADQVTEYVYGGKLDGVRLSILVDSVLDPMGRISSFSYNRQQERRKYTDPNNTIHSYTFDALGRLKLDSIQPGLQLAAHVVGLAYEYNERGLPKRIQSLDRNGKTVNEIYRLYNQFGLLRFEAQHHFDPEEEGYGKTIDYGYDVGGMAQISAGTDEEPAVYLVGHPPRLSTIIYPRCSAFPRRDDAVIHLGYFDRLRSDAVNRVAFVAEGEETSAEADPIIGRQSTSKRPLAVYTHFGLADMYRVSYPETGDIALPGKPLSFDANGAFPPSNLADDLEYDALDRFDRLVELNWGQRGYGFGERLAYWYDRVGSRLARRSRPYVPWSPNAVYPPVTRTHDERYQYDALYRLRDMHRGTVPGNFTRDPQTPGAAPTPTFHQKWQLDQQDNWERLDEQAFGDEGYQFGQTRTHDRSNRVKTIMSGGPPVSVAFDDAGNMDYIPDATDPGNLDKGLYCEYDAWNRLVHVRRGGRPVADYEYDGLGRRIVKRVYHKDTGVLTEARHFYYSQGWQVLQERVAVDPEGETPWETRLDRQYVWGVRGQDDLILRDRDASQPPNGVTDERLYALADANGNIVSLYDVIHPDPPGVGLAERLVERVEYDAYGHPRFMDNDFGSLSESGKDWNILYGGYYYDAETGQYHVRNRMYHPLYGRWLQTDPSGFDDSYNLYQYGLSSPLTGVDPTGRWWEDVALGIPSILLGVHSLRHDIREGNVGWAIADAIGIVADVVAIALPVIPGVVGASIKAYRAGDLAADAARATRGGQIALGLHHASEAVQTADTLANVWQSYDAAQRGEWWQAAFGSLHVGIRGMQATLAARRLLRTPMGQRGAGYALRGISRIPTYTPPPFQRLPFSSRLKRLFVEDTRTYSAGKRFPRTLVGRTLKRLLPRVDWELHHTAIYQRAYRRRNPANLVYRRGSHELRGLQRLGDAGWNLVPLPKSVHARLTHSPVLATTFAIGVYGLGVPVAFGLGFVGGDVAVDVVSDRSVLDRWRND